MEWFKVKTNHALIEYSDFTEKQIGAWIIAMALTASLEKMPSEAQLKKYIHGSTLKSLELGLSLHGVTLELVLSKVLDDVEYALSLKQTNRSKIANWRKKKENVTSNVTVTEPDKIREEKIREEEKDVVTVTPPPQPPDLSSFLQTLKSKKEYSHIDIDNEIEKIDAWLLNNPKRKKTKTFIINWLDKIEVPFEASDPKSDFEKFCKQEGIKT